MLQSAVLVLLLSPEHGLAPRPDGGGLEQLRVSVMVWLPVPHDLEHSVRPDSAHSDHPPSTDRQRSKGYRSVSYSIFYNQVVHCSFDSIAIMTRLNRLVSEAWMSECCSCGSHTGSLLSISGLFEIVFKVMIHFRALFCDYKMMYRVTNRCHVVCNATRP